MNPHELAKYDLPQLESLEDVANAMELKVWELALLATHNDNGTTDHYIRFEIPKKSGGKRRISSPSESLRVAQYWILGNILSKVTPSEIAHGFIPGRSIASMAEPHKGAPCVVNVDVKDFFPSVIFPRVKALFVSLGFGEGAAWVMGLVCTEPPPNRENTAVEIEERQLPQGACTSPALTNILCRRMDKELLDLTEAMGWTVTRYADDIAFSGPDTDRVVVDTLLEQATQIIEAEDFALHPDKLKVCRKGKRQEVCGLVVNDKVGIPREEIRNFRALLHDALKNGPDAANRGRHDDFYAYIQGFSAYMYMVDSEKAQPYRELVQQIWERYYQEQETEKAFDFSGSQGILNCREN